MKKLRILSALLLIVIALSLLLSSCDALATERAAAEEEIRTAQAVKDNPWDGGVAALVEEYASKIASAPDADAIRTVVSEFGAAVEAHVNAKNSLLAEVQAVDISSFFSYDPFHLSAEVLAARDEAVFTVKTASTLAEAETALASYKTFVLKKIGEQPYGPCDDLDRSPEFAAKVALLTFIDGYGERAQLLADALTEAYENGEITEEEYNLGTYGKAADENGEAVYGCEYVIARISWWSKYANLAIRTDGLQAEFEAEIDPLLAAIEGILPDGAPSGETA